MTLGTVAAEPFVQAAAVRMRTEGFTEQGGAAALAGLRRTHDVAFSTIGLRGEARLGADLPIVAQAMAGWRPAARGGTPAAPPGLARGGGGGPPPPPRAPPPRGPAGGGGGLPPARALGFRGGGGLALPARRRPRRGGQPGGGGGPPLPPQPDGDRRILRRRTRRPCAGPRRQGPVRHAVLSLGSAHLDMHHA